MTRAGLRRLGFENIVLKPNGTTTAVYRDHLYTFGKDGRCVSSAPIAEIRITTMADAWEARGDRWNARNDQVHAQADRRPNDVEGYDEPTCGPRAAIHKQAPVELPIGTTADARLRANRLRRAFDALAF